MARVKAKNSIITREHAEEALGRIDELDRQFTSWDLAEAAAIAKVRERFAQRRKVNLYAVLQTEKTCLVKELKVWSETDKNNWNGKSLIMSFGSIGYRVLPPTVTLLKSVAKSFDVAIKLLKPLKDKLIRTKEEVDKEAVLAAFRDKEITAEELAMYGLKIKNDDEFWIETKASKALDEAVKKLKAA